MTRKKTYIEFLRIIACFFVIVNHTNSGIFLSKSPSPVWFASLTCFFISKSAVPIFLMIMGSVLLEKQDTAKKSLSRIARIAIVLFLASFLYFTYHFFRSSGEGAVFRVGTFLKKLLAGTHETSALWYLFLYLALLCLLPLMQTMAAAFSKGQLRLLLILSLGVLGTIPLISALTPLELTLLSKYGVLFSPFIGMVFSGYYIDRYVEITRRKFYLSAVVFFLLLLFEVWCTYLLYLRDPSSYLALDDRSLVPITGQAICIYVAVKYLFSRVILSEKTERVICFLGSLTFGIYLLGDLLVELLEPLYRLLGSFLHELPAVVLWQLCIFAAGAVITMLLRAIPPLRRLL